MRTYTLILTSVLITIKISAQPIYISGDFKNFGSKKLVIKYDLDNPVCNIKKEYTFNTENNGHFNIQINDLRYLSVSNWIQIGSKKIYLCLEPGDSIFITYNKNDKSIIFAGSHPECNNFINAYHIIIDKRKNPRNIPNKDSAVALIERNFVSDSIKLNNTKDLFHLDNDFVYFFMNYIKIDYLCFLSTISFPKSNCHPEFIKEVSNINLTNDYLRYNMYYYSVISGYSRCILNKKLSAFNCDSLRSNMLYCDKLLQQPFNESYKAYLIGYYFLQFVFSKKDYGDDIVNITKEFLDSCGDEILKAEIRQLFSMKSIKI